VFTKPAILGGTPVLPPGPHHRWPHITASDEAAVLATLRAGELSVHRRSGVVEEFEEAFRALVGTRWVLSTGSGTAALHASYFGLDLAPGDEVIAPAYTHLSTVVPMLQAHLVPVLCDVDPETGNLDPRAAAAAVTPRTRAIVVTHQYGHPCAMDEVEALATRHGLRIVEDCSHSHGAQWRGRPVGSIGDVGAFSLQAHKAVVAGEGGALLTDDPALFERACLLGHFRAPTPASDEVARSAVRFAGSGYGLKNRVHPLGAALALSQLRRLSEVNRRRARHRARLEAHLRDIPGLRLGATHDDVERGGFFRLLLHVEPDALDGLTVERLVEALHAEGATDARPGAAAVPVHHLPILQTLDDRMTRTGWPRRGPHVDCAPTYRRGDFPRAEAFSRWTLQLPAFTWEEDALVDSYAEALARVCAAAPLIAHHFTRSAS